MKRLNKFLVFTLVTIIILGSTLQVSAADPLGKIMHRGYTNSTWSSTTIPDLSMPAGYEPFGWGDSGMLIINATTGDIKFRTVRDTTWSDYGGTDVPISVGFEPAGWNGIELIIVNPVTGGMLARKKTENTWHSVSGFTSSAPFPAGYEPVGFNEAGSFFITNPVTGDLKYINSGTWSNAGTGAPIPADYEVFGITDYIGEKGYLDIIRTNFSPNISITSPSINGMYSDVSGYNTINLTGTVTDKNPEDLLTTKYNFDGGTPQTIAGTVTASGPFTSTSINVGSLTEGNHTLNVWVEDSFSYSSPIKAIPFKVDKSLPTIGIFDITTSESSINVTATATDNLGLNSTPYKYTIGTYPSSEWTTSTSYSKTGLLPNTPYAVKFQARDLVGHIKEEIQNRYTKAAIPSFNISNPTSYTLDLGLTDNNPTTTEYQINVNNSQYVTPEGIPTTAQTWIPLSTRKITIKNLMPNTQYSFLVKARNGEGIETTWSSPVSGTTLIAPPVAPKNTISTATNNSITVVWDPVAGSTGYEIEADGRIIDVGTYTSYVHENLVPFTQHTYRVRAKNAGGLGAWSEQISKYTEQNNPNSPFNIDAAANNTSIIVTWKPIPGSTAYDIEADGVVINNYSSTNYVHSGLIPGTMHSYRVRSINSAGKSEWSNEILISTQIEAPLIPDNITATPSRNNITVMWNPIQGATYEIEVDGNIRDNGTSNTFIHSNLVSGSSHNYRVRTKKSGSLSDWSSFVTETVPLEEFGTPSNIKVEATDTTIALSWNPVVDAIGYEIELNEIVGNSLTNTNGVFNKLTPNTQYIFRVRAKGIDKVSDWSEYKPIMTYALPTPTNIMTIASGDNISITWDEVAGAESYDLDIDGQLLGDITSIPYIHPILDSNTQHTYKVRARNTTGFSAWSKTFSETPQAGGTNAPSGIVAFSMTDSINMMWKPTPDATSYDIDVDGAIVQGIINTSYTQIGLEPGTQHSYKVRAISNGVQSDWSNTAMVMTLPIAPPTPTNVTVSSTTSSVLITWDTIEDATEYELEIDGLIVSTGISTKYLHSSLTPDSSHTYKVRARNISDWGLWSDALTINTKSAVQTYEIQSTNGQVFNLVLAANDITDPSKYTYTITYNAEELEVLDLCATTSRIDMVIGNVVGTDIQIVQYTPGTIVFKKFSSSTGQAWTGQINSIKFKSKTDNATQVIYSFE